MSFCPGEMQGHGERLVSWTSWKDGHESSCLPHPSLLLGVHLFSPEMPWRQSHFWKDKKREVRLDVCAVKGIACWKFILTLYPVVVFWVNSLPADLLEAASMLSIESFLALAQMFWKSKQAASEAAF